MLPYLPDAWITQLTHNDLRLCVNELHLIARAYVPLFCFSGGQHGAVQPFSDEDASIETLSHCSSFSDATSVADEGRFVCTPDCTLFERVCSLNTSNKSVYDLLKCFFVFKVARPMRIQPRRISSIN